MRDGHFIANDARALSLSPHSHCAGVFANVALAVLLSRWRCRRHRAGTVTFAALAHGCYRCCCVCVFANVALPLSPSHGPNVVVTGASLLASHWRRSAGINAVSWVTSQTVHGRRRRHPATSGVIAVLALVSSPLRWH